jgi:hypothetical protein
MNLNGSVLGLYGHRYFLKVSLKAKFKAWVGKYLMTLAKFPLYKAFGPSSEITLEKQFPIPVYLGTSPDWILGLAS